MKGLDNIIQELKAPKSRYNKFGNFYYRNCEDILEGVKPLLKKHGLSMRISDKPILVGNYQYVEATITITDGESEISVTASAREPESKKGMDTPQITGTASSYARKYALNGLFLIDDTRDISSMEPDEPLDDTKKPATDEQMQKIVTLIDHFTGEQKIFLENASKQQLTVKKAQDIIDRASMKLR